MRVPRVTVSRTVNLLECTRVWEMAERGLMVYASKEGGPDWQYEWLPGSRYEYRLLSDLDTFMVGMSAHRGTETPGDFLCAHQ